jgi:hypothetical protein
LEHYKTSPMQGIGEAYNGLKKLKFWFRDFQWF